jgi:hypothetical protein
MSLLTGGRVIVNPRLTKKKEFSGLVRATAPALLNKESRCKIPKAIRKIEAEAVTFVVCEAIRYMDAPLTGDHYIRVYRGNDELLIESLLRIHKVATDILENLGFTIDRERPIVGTHWKSWWEDVLVKPIDQRVRRKAED